MRELDLKYSKKQSELFFPEKHFPKFTICPKGRRAGITTGAAQAFIEYGLSEDFWFLRKGEIYLLWGDVISANIDKYVERLFMPILRKLDPSDWKWRQQERVLKVGRATIDFRSADRPENWEGFGYDLIFANEAGIILENDYLFNNCLLPMLMDYADSKIILGGTPKGKRNKKGLHKFYELYQLALRDPVKYRILTFNANDNPFIAKGSVENTIESMDEVTAKQEIWGEFVDTTEMKFLYCWNENLVIPEFKPNPHLPILISFDFNVEPMTCVIGQSLDPMTSIVFDEIEISSGSTYQVCDEIKKRYPNFDLMVTGDATGRNRSALVRGNLNHYRIIKQELNLFDRDILVENSNPSQKDSRVLCNSVLSKANHRVTANCTSLINDLFSGCVDAEGQLVKNSKIGLHLLDAWRYWIECSYVDFVKNPSKYITTLSNTPQPY